MDLNNILNKIYPLALEQKTLLANCFTEISLPKGSLLFQQDKIEQKFFFIKKGIVRAFTVIDGNEITFWFGEEGAPVLSMKSYVHNKTGYETIELLEDCTFYEIPLSKLNNLYEKHLPIANWGRKLAETELIKTEERFIDRQTGNALQRYNNLLKNTPTLINRIALGHIASYLGITQVSLSRIRSEVK